jgi:hypothetical protein
MMAGLVCYDGRAGVLKWQGCCGMMAGLVCYDGRAGVLRRQFAMMTGLECYGNIEP